MASSSVTFDLFARDRASGAFVKVGQAAQKAGREMDGLNRRMGSMSGRFAAISRVGPRSFGLLATGAKAAGLALGAAAVSAGIFGLKTASNMEQARISFTTMLGSAQKADVFLRQLQKFAASTPFEFPELQTAASSLISAGINANKVIPIMRTLGDVTSGMGTGSEGVRRATIALQQMSAAGRITGEDLNQLRDAGVPVFDLLAAATGRTKAQVAALAQAGKLGGKDLAQLMKALETGKGLERFSGLMEKQSHSLAGLFSTLKDNVSMSLANMITPAMPAIKAGLEWLTNVTAVAGPKVAGAFAVIGKGFRILRGGFTDGLQGNVGFAGALERTGDVARTLAVFFTGTVIPALQKLGGFVADNRELFTAMAKGVVVVTAAFAAFRLVMLGVNFVMAVNPIGAVIVALGALVGATVYAYQHSERFRQVVASVWAAIKQVGAFLMRTFTPTFQALGQTVSTRVVPPLLQLWAAVQRNMPAFIVFAKFIGGVIAVVAALAAKILGFLLPILVRLAGFLLGRLFGLIARTIQYFGNLVRAVQAGWAGFQAFLRIVSGVWTTFVVRTKEAIDRVVGWVTGLGHAIVTKFSAARGWLAQAGRNVLYGLWDGFLFVWKKITSWIGTLTGWIKDHKGPPAFDRKLLFQAGKDIMGGFERGLKHGGLRALGFVESVAGSVRSALGGSQSTSFGAMQKMVAGYASMLYGWRGAQWDALYKLVMRESGFNPNAQNPSSTAYGLGQFLNSTWATVNATKTSNPQLQTLAMLRYIKKNYTDPVGAWNHEQVFGWYSKGLAPTVFSRPTMIGVGERGPETVTVTPRRAAVREQPTTVINVSLTTIGQLDPQATNKIRQAIREALRAEGKAATARML